MGLFDNLFKKNEPQPAPQATNAPDFVFGIEDIFQPDDSDNIIVAGTIRGTVISGAAAYLYTWNDDDNPVTLTTIQSIGVNQQIVSQASNCSAKLLIKDGAKLNIRIGSVLATRNISSKDVHDAYMDAIVVAYWGIRHLEISDEEFSHMSITDIAEAWRFYLFANHRDPEHPLDSQDIAREKMDRLGAELTKRLLELQHIHIVYSTKTGEPYLFSQTIDQGDGTYRTTPPEIMMITEPYLEIYREHYSKDGLEIHTIDRGKDGYGISQMFYAAFYLNGACALRINGKDVGIAAEKVLEPPTYEGVPEIQIPVTNPDLMRWILLMGQMQEPTGEDAELIFRLYYGFLLRELPKAKFLIPMKQNIPCPPPDENGMTTLKKDTQFYLATQPGKHERDAIRMYTDWKRMQQTYDKDWNSMIQPISGMIDVFDCAINVTKLPAVGIYVDKDTYEAALNHPSNKSE